MFMNKKPGNIREKFSDAFELPKDIVLDIPRITMLGQNQINIENHKGIIEYDEDIIRINTGNGILKIIGKGLAIKSVIQEEIIIEGEIFSLSF